MSDISARAVGVMAFAIALTLLPQLVPLPSGGLGLVGALMWVPLLAPVGMALVAAQAGLGAKARSALLLAAALGLLELLVAEVPFALTQFGMTGVLPASFYSTASTFSPLLGMVAFAALVWGMRFGDLIPVWLWIAGIAVVASKAMLYLANVAQYVGSSASAPNEASIFQMGLLTVLAQGLAAATIGFWLVWGMRFVRGGLSNKRVNSTLAS